MKPKNGEQSLQATTPATPEEKGEATRFLKAKYRLVKGEV